MSGETCGTCRRFCRMTMSCAVRNDGQGMPLIVLHADWCPEYIARGEVDELYERGAKALLPLGRDTGLFAMPSVCVFDELYVVAHWQRGTGLTYRFVDLRNGQVKGKLWINPRSAWDDAVQWMDGGCNV